MAISNSAVLAGLLAKLPSFCSFPSSPSLCRCLLRNMFIPTLLTASSLPTSPPGGPTAHPKKLLGFSFPHLARGSEARPSRCLAAALESVMSRTRTHAYIDRRLIDWLLVTEMQRWGRRSGHWSCWLRLSRSEMALTYTHWLKEEKTDEACIS